MRNKQDIHNLIVEDMQPDTVPQEVAEELINRAQAPLDAAVTQANDIKMQQELDALSSAQTNSLSEKSYAMNKARRRQQDSAIAAADSALYLEELKNISRRQDARVDNLIDNRNRLAQQSDTRSIWQNFSREVQMLAYENSAGMEETLNSMFSNRGRTDINEPGFWDELNPFSQQNLMKKHTELVANCEARSISGDCSGSTITPELAAVFSEATLGTIGAIAPGESIVFGATSAIRGSSAATRIIRSRVPNKLGSISSEAQLALRGVSDADLQSIAKLHQSNPQLVDDLLKQMTFKGQKIERKGGAAFEGVSDALPRLRTSIDNYNIVQKRGYPFGFNSLDEFQSYKTTVVDSLRRYGIPTDNIRIQGSAVHSKTPGDIDVIVSVGDDAFDALSKQFISASTQPKVAKQIAKEASKGKIPSYRFGTNPAQPKTIGQTLYDPNKLPNQISLIRQGSDFDLGPFLNF